MLLWNSVLCDFSYISFFTTFQSWSAYRMVAAAVDWMGRTWGSWSLLLIRLWSLCIMGVSEQITICGNIIWSKLLTGAIIQSIGTDILVASWSMTALRISSSIYYTIAIRYLWVCVFTLSQSLVGAGLLVTSVWRGRLPSTLGFPLCQVVSEQSASGLWNACYCSQ